MRVQLRPTSSSTIRDPATIAAAVTKNAADDGSAGTCTSSSSSSSHCHTRTVVPSRTNGTCAPMRKRSVWSRLRVGSVKLVSRSAIRAAISTHDFTCALATSET